MRHAHAVVGDVDPHLVLDDIRGNTDLSFGRRVFGGVGQQVADDLRQAGEIAFEPQGLGRQGDRQVMRARLDLGSAGVHGGLDDALQTHTLALKGNLALIDPGDVEQVFDQPREVVGLNLHPRLDVGLAVLVRLALQKLKTGAERHYRVAQLMAQHGDEVVFAAVRRAQGVGVGLQFIALGENLPALAIEVDEDVRLAAQDVGFDRFLDEVDGPGLIAPEPSLQIGASRRDEDDGDVARVHIAAHELGQLKTVHAWHLHVHQGQGDIVDQQQLQRLVARAGLQADDVLPLQQRLQREQVFFKVVDQQKVNRLFRAAHSVPRPFRCSAMPSSGRATAAVQALRAAWGMAWA
ncbi:hypothetical protein D3C73_515490 [compost metagenome]